VLASNNSTALAGQVQAIKSSQWISYHGGSLGTSGSGTFGIRLAADTLWLPGLPVYPPVRPVYPPVRLDYNRCNISMLTMISTSLAAVRLEGNYMVQMDRDGDKQKSLTLPSAYECGKIEAVL